MSYCSRVYNHRNAHSNEGAKEPFFAKQNDTNRSGQRGSFFQAKLSVNAPGDKYEREADSVANAVMHQKTVTPVAQQKNIQRLSTAMEDEKLSTNDARMALDKEIQEKPLTQNSSSNVASSGITSGINRSSGNGNRLPQQTLHEMNTSFGTDFSSVNIHNDSEAANMNAELSAQAFTHGSDIYFNKGKYNPSTSEGKFLLAHELTHVVQQHGGISTKKLNDEEKANDLTSTKYKDNERLQSAFDNSPLLKFGECNEAVRLLQEGLVADGFAMPISTNEEGEMDGDFGTETSNTIMNFQSKHKLGRDGIVGRDTLSELDAEANTNNLASLTHLTSVKCHPKAPKVKPAPPEAGCKMHAEYANKRTIDRCVSSSCGAALRFDIKKITKSGSSCPADFSGKVLNERVSVVDAETTCPHKGSVVTGSANIEKDGTLINATDTYGICFPKKITSDLMQVGFSHCDAVMSQELIIDGSVFEVRRISLRVDFNIDFNDPTFITCSGSGSVS
ncbi:MAG: DUF4157 domain-containing protein [Ginsengibacter sp.]